LDVLCDPVVGGVNARGSRSGTGLIDLKGILDQHQAIIKVDRSFPTTCFQIGFPMARA
jgi:hypothetical protein